MREAIENIEAPEKHTPSRGAELSMDVRGGIRSLALLCLAVATNGCIAGVKKDIADVAPSYGQAAVARAQTDQSVTSVSIDVMRTVIPPDELDAFEKLSNASSNARKIRFAASFVTRYPSSLLIQQVKSGLQYTASQLSTTVDKLLAAAQSASIDEMAIFVDFDDASVPEKKIHLGVSFLAEYPSSFAVPYVRTMLRESESHLFDNVDRLFASAKANPGLFLNNHVVEDEEDKFLTTAIQFMRLFPGSSRRNDVLGLMKSYVSVMGYACVTIDSNDSRMANQSLVHAGELAFVKYFKEIYSETPFTGNPLGEIWSSSRMRTVGHTWAVISVDGKRVALSSVTRTERAPTMWEEMAGGMMKAGTSAVGAFVSTMDYLTEKGWFSPGVMDEFPRFGELQASPTVQSREVPPAGTGISEVTSKVQQRREKCDTYCKKNWVDTCGKGPHTLLPGENYTESECKQHHQECRDKCNKKYPTAQP